MGIFRMGQNLEVKTTYSRVQHRLVGLWFVPLSQGNVAPDILGCTGLSWMAPDLRERLKARGLDAPVIQPIWAAVAFARMLVRLDMRHSPMAYPPPGPAVTH